MFGKFCCGDIEDSTKGYVEFDDQDGYWIHWKSGNAESAHPIDDCGILEGMSDVWKRIG